MSEAVSVGSAKPFSSSRAILAGLIATVVITISLAFFGMNIMKSLGGMMLPTAGATAQYLLGGIVHLMIGLFYGVVYAWFFGRVTEWNPALKGIVFGLVITAIALAAMPVLASMMGAGGAAAPCTPCTPAAAATPCTPCTPKAASPCTPCTPKAATPCTPCTPKAASPCNPCAVKEAAGPCSPCGGGGQDPYSGLVSVINHVIYGLALAFVYRTRPAV